LIKINDLNHFERGGFFFFTEQKKLDFISHAGLVSLNLLLNVLVPLLRVRVFTSTAAGHDDDEIHKRLLKKVGGWEEKEKKKNLNKIRKK